MSGREGEWGDKKIEKSKRRVEMQNVKTSVGDKEENEKLQDLEECSFQENNLEPDNMVRPGTDMTHSQQWPVHSHHRPQASTPPDIVVLETEAEAIPAQLQPAFTTTPHSALSLLPPHIVPCPYYHPT
ncbi:hypothetical protein Pcinc_037397 [Petrolisthes cinctipes]|uniref:Uncharacterized protein n=1 Tax=Petrolisthes cinctipes TaxID=88211 RepID=A0AAE1ELK2_PETCI|nr:hypothetical protein Pcinc_037397 [Petrolisthes cinctipes]